MVQDDNFYQQLQYLTQRLLHAQAEITACVDDLSMLIGSASIDSDSIPRPRLPSPNGELSVSSTTRCVQWRGRRCTLGPSLLFKLIHRLSFHQGRYFTYEMLKDDVWQTRCSDDAVRALVKRLRRALVDSDMADLASAIRGRGRCYGLFVEDPRP